MSLINDALKKAQHVQARKAAGAAAAHHPAPTARTVPAEPVSNTMPDIQPSGGRKGMILVAATLGLVTLGGAGYMFFLRADADPVVVQRHVTPVTREASPTPRPAPAVTEQPATLEEAAPESAAVEVVVEPLPAPTPDPFFSNPLPRAAPVDPIEDTVAEVVPQPADEIDLFPSAGPEEFASEILTEPITDPIATTPEPPAAPAPDPAPVVAEIETPAAPEPAPAANIETPVASAPVAAAEEPAASAVEPTLEAEVTAAPEAPEPAPVAIQPAPPPKPTTVADPEIQRWVDSINVAGLRMSAVPKVLMNDRVYAQGEMVQFDYEVRLIEVGENLLKFKDPQGHTYYHRF